MSGNKAYNRRLVERKWQDVWEKQGIYTPDTHFAPSTSLRDSRGKFYNLWMFPYPSAEGLHAGHAFSSTGSDIYGRFMRMNGKSVFQPIGYDSFGIHSENYAIKIGESPQKMLSRTTKHYEEQLRSLGHGYDWTRTVTTSDPDYYRWTQWLFVQMFKAGLAYKKKASVNWCPSCKTVLADEQVIGGQCERCQSKVGKKDLEQWFFRITDYADKLLAGLDKIDWSQRVVKAQREWIGKSTGMLIKFEIRNPKSEIEVFTTRPDTLESATFIATSSKDLDSLEESKEKLGKFTGKYAINPLNGRKLPIWETNYVEAGYGTGIIMGVPVYDERDMEFAKKYSIDIVNKKLNDGLWKEIEERGWGKKYTNYHLRDWLVSRQRYWGTPIPMIYCEKCARLCRQGWQPIPEKDLPVKLPEISDYKPEGTGKGPLANHPDFYKTKCPKCGAAARRETDVMDTFVDSSWYFLRYPSVGLDSGSSLLRGPRRGGAASRSASADRDLLPFDPKITKKWLPVDLYFGGAEHAVLHLMYARFVTMVLHDLGYLNFNEPFPRFFAHGLMIKDGAKMSKSRGNVVNPDEYIAKYGADTLRLYLMFLGPMDRSPDFRDTGIEGMHRFVKRVWKLLHQNSDSGSSLLRGPRRGGAASRSASADRNLDNVVLGKMHQTIKKVTEDIQEFKYNTAIAAIMEFVNVLYDASTRSSLRTLCLLLAPFAPHLAEEVWSRIERRGALKRDKRTSYSSIHLQPWPKYDPKYLQTDQVVIVIQVNGKLRGQITVNSGQSKNKKEITKLAKEDEKIVKWLDGRMVKKEIFVPGKLVNFVI